MTLRSGLYVCFGRSARVGVTVFAAAVLLVAMPAMAVVVISDGFGDADINNNGIPLEDVDTDIGATPPNGLENTFVPAQYQDINGDGQALNEVTSVLDASDTGIRWLQTRGFTGGSSTNAGTGQSKPTLRIFEDTPANNYEGVSLDSGYAMTWESRGGGSSAVGFFDQTIELGPEVGDEVKVSFDFRFWDDASNANPSLEPVSAELRFGLFQDTDNQLGQTNPFAGRQVDLNNDGFVDDVPAVWGQEEGFFEGSLTGERGPGDDVGTNGDNGWTASVFAGNSIVPNGGGTRIREELQADRLLQGSDVHTIAQPENLNPDPFGVPEFDFVTIDNNHIFNFSLSLVRATDTTPGDTITATLTIHDKTTDEMWSLSGTEDLEDATSGGVPVPGTGGIQSDSWDYFALRNASSGTSEFDFILDNFLVEQFGSNAMQDVTGDFNGDGQVDNGDLNLLLGSWGDSSVPAEWVNGFVAPVDNGELNDLLGNWGFGVSTAVPEPATLTAALLLGTLLCVRRRTH